MVRRKGQQIPDIIKPFVDLGFDYDERKVSSNNAVGNCIFCGKSNHFFLNQEDGQWDCKVCLKKGNKYTFIQEWYKMFLAEQNDPNQKPWIRLAKLKGLEVDVLKEAGIVYDGERFAFPIRSQQGRITSLRFYNIDTNKLINIAMPIASFFGAEKLSDPNRTTEPVYICEGEWDKVALDYLLDLEEQKGVVVGMPGAGTFKDLWVDLFSGRDVVICFDNDNAGETGALRVFSKLTGRAKKVDHIEWPSDLPEGFDVRDFVNKDGSYDDLKKIIKPFKSPSDQEDKPNIAAVPFNSPDRPTWNDVLAVYRKHLNMTPDLEDCLRLIFAVILSVHIETVPLWLHIVAPPGAGKTELIMSTADCPLCYPVSTLTPHSLISGFAQAGGGDPSLLAKLNGKVLLVKDFTEVLAMPKVNKDEVFGTLRGAYDGHVDKNFGNGITRKYEVMFNQVTGVTAQIYAERSAQLGERYLMFHMLRGKKNKSEDSIRLAIRNVGKQKKIKSELREIAAKFLNVTITEEDYPEIEQWVENRIVALAQVVAILRAQVERDRYSGSSQENRKMLYRPEPEEGTRLAQQFVKTLIGLGLENTPAKIGEEEYRLIVRCAVDTCIGFNLEVVASLIERGEQTKQELAEDCNMPITTLSDQLADLMALGALIVKKVNRDDHVSGRPMNVYHVSQELKELWNMAGLTRENGMIKSINIEKKKLKIRVVRKKRK